MNWFAARSYAEALSQSDPTGELTKILKSWAGWSAPAKYKDVWFSGDLKRALLVVETKAAGFDTDAQAAAQRTLSAEFESIQRDVQGHSRLVMSGPGVIAVNVQQMIEAEPGGSRSLPQA